MRTQRSRASAAPIQVPATPTARLQPFQVPATPTARPQGSHPGGRESSFAETPDRTPLRILSMKWHLMPSMMPPWNPAVTSSMIVARATIANLPIAHADRPRLPSIVAMLVGPFDVTSKGGVDVWLSPTSYCVNRRRTSLNLHIATFDFNSTLSHKPIS